MHNTTLPVTTHTQIHLQTPATSSPGNPFKQASNKNPGEEKKLKIGSQLLPRFFFFFPPSKLTSRETAGLFFAVF